MILVESAIQHEYERNEAERGNIINIIKANKLEQLKAFPDSILAYNNFLSVVNKEKKEDVVKHEEKKEGKEKKEDVFNDEEKEGKGEKKGKEEKKDVVKQKEKKDEIKKEKE
uniref:Uncharacterized protein n=1 Tax=Meloidogyne javanica TaxID=6303 RepID=A0A915N5H5_MELJA